MIVMVLLMSVSWCRVVGVCGCLARPGPRPTARRGGRRHSSSRLAYSGTSGNRSDRNFRNALLYFGLDYSCPGGRGYPAFQIFRSILYWYRYPTIILNLKFTLNSFVIPMKFYSDRILRVLRNPSGFDLIWLDLMFDSDSSLI